MRRRHRFFFYYDDDHHTLIWPPIRPRWAFYLVIAQPVGWAMFILLRISGIVG